jgi:hypothetical protein
MAVDTREKRMSMLNFGDGSNLHVLWEPDGTVDADDRQHLLDCYSGIAFAAPSAPSATLLLLPPNKRSNKALGMKGGKQ